MYLRGLIRILFLLFLCPSGYTQISVTTQHNDLTSSGWTKSETVLRPANVNVRQFGKLFSVAVDDQVYTQPLILSKVMIGDSLRNVAVVGTVNNTVYAFDADNGTLFWSKNYTAPGLRVVYTSDFLGPLDALQELTVYGAVIPACQAPGGIAVMMIDTNFSVIRWDRAGNASGYNVNFKPKSFSSWQTYSTTDNSLFISGLGCNTYYQYAVQSHPANFPAGMAVTSNDTSLRSNVILDGWSVDDSPGNNINSSFSFNTGDINVANATVPQPNLKIYPNPTTKDFWIDFDILHKQNVVLSVIGMGTGLILFKENLMNFSGHYQKQFEKQVYHRAHTLFC